MGGGGDTVIIRMFLGELNKQFTKKNHCYDNLYLVEQAYR